MPDTGLHGCYPVTAGIDFISTSRLEKLRHTKSYLDQLGDNLLNTPVGLIYTKLTDVRRPILGVDSTIPQMGTGLNKTERVSCVPATICLSFPAADGMGPAASSSCLHNFPTMPGYTLTLK